MHDEIVSVSGLIVHIVVDVAWSPVVSA